MGSDGVWAQAVLRDPRPGRPLVLLHGGLHTIGLGFGPLLGPLPGPGPQPADDQGS
jgi:hypothetical protein